MSGSAASGHPARWTEAEYFRARRSQHAPEVIGEERHERRDGAKPLDEREPERPESDRVTVPEPAPRAPDVPVRDVVDEGLVGADDVHRKPILVALGGLADERVCSFHEPAVERLELCVRPALEIGPLGLPAVDVGVVDEELARVPERQSSLRWISWAGPKPKRRFWFGGCEQYCQRITSAPMRAKASGASIVFPHELCISRPFSSNIFS